MSRNVDQVYIDNPSSSIPTGALIYLGLSPYGLTNDSAITADNAGLAGLTTGSVIFANSSGNLAQNNSKLIWDNTNFRMGIGGSIFPTNTLTVRGDCYLDGNVTVTGGIAIASTPIQLAAFTTGILHVGITGLLSSSAVNLANADVSNVLPETKGGTNQSSYTTGDILYASAANTLSKLADVATGNALISGGVSTAPSWGKIGLTTHVSGTLGVGNGGTGTATTFTQGSIIFAGASGIYSQDNNNLFWNDSTGQFSVNTNSPISDTVGQFSSTKAFCLTSFGTQTSVSSITSAGAAVQSGFTSLSAFSPTNGANLCTSYFAGTDIIIPTGKTATLVTSYSANPITNDNVGTVTSYAAYYFDGGNNAGTGTYTNTYGLLINKPIFGSTKITGRILGRTQIGTAQQFDVSDSGVVTAGTWNAGVIAEIYGGTNQSSYTTGDLLQASASNTLSKLAAVATGNALISGGVATVSSWGKIGLTTHVSGLLPLANGGTNANLTASNGGIFYSTASAGAILAGTATANQVLLSGSSTTPAWSTATYPATTTINQILYSSSANTIGGITTANNGVLITSSGGVPSISSTIPNATQDNITRLGTIANVGAAIGVSFGGTGTATNFTAGSVIFAGASGIYSQDNSNFFWDSTNHWLGLGTASPTKLLHMSSSTSNEPTLVIENTNTDALAPNIKFYKNSSGSTNNDSIGEIYFNGKNSAHTANTRYADITCISTVVTAGAEEGAFSIRTAVGGTVMEVFRIQASNITLGSGSTSQLTYNGVTTTVANSGGTALPALAQGFMDVIINGTHRKIPYYLN